MKFRLLMFSLALTGLWLGCQESPEPAEVTQPETLQLPVSLAITEKRLDEPLTEDEIQGFLELVSRFPDGKIPELSPVTIPGRNEPESLEEIAAEARRSIRESLTVETLQKGWTPTTSVRRILRDEQIESRAVISLMLRLSCAVAANSIGNPRTIRAQQLIMEEKLNQLIARIQSDQKAIQPDSEAAVESLKEIASMAEYLAILSSLPVQSLASVREHQQELAVILPPVSAGSDLAETREETHVKSVSFEQIERSKPRKTHVPRRTPKR